MQISAGVLYVGFACGAVRSWSCEEATLGEHVQDYDTGHKVVALLVDEELKQLVVSSLDCRVRVFDIGDMQSNGEPKRVFNEHTGMVTTLRVTGHGDDSVLYTASQDWTVKAWHLPRKRTPPPVPPPPRDKKAESKYDGKKFNELSELTEERGIKHGRADTVKTLVIKLDKHDDKQLQDVFSKQLAAYQYSLAGESRELAMNYPSSDTFGGHLGWVRCMVIRDGRLVTGSDDSHVKSVQLDEHGMTYYAPPVAVADAK
jgi:WD40 repeat protein